MVSREKQVRQSRVILEFQLEVSLSDLLDSKLSVRVQYPMSKKSIL